MPDYMFLLESRLSPEQRAVMLRVQELSAALGFNVYLTGGTVRALTIHSFTNQPVRLLRVLRYAARMGFKIEQRTQEWFDLAIERNLQETIAPEDAGDELRALAREERPAVVLKAWEEHDLLEAVNPVLAKKHPSYDAIARAFENSRLSEQVATHSQRFAGCGHRTRSSWYGAWAQVRRYRRTGLRHAAHRSRQDQRRARKNPAKAFRHQGTAEEKRKGKEGKGHRQSSCCSGHGRRS